MLNIISFNSIDFFIFFLIVFFLYWIIPQKTKNLILLIASYVFYASWSFKLLALVFISTYIDYFCGLAINSSNKESKRKFFLITSVLVNLGLLGFFKYYNFFTQNLITLLNSIGLNLNFTSLNIILPIGISFYTFQTLSYTIDIYRRKILPTRNIIDFSLFVVYFPQLVAGPIERAKELIPKIKETKYFKNIEFKKGTYLIVYGLFKKVVIADSIAVIVDSIFSSTNPTGTSVLIAAYAFAIQIYCDFSGYSNMARGLSYFFGIKLETNFILPYFAKNPSDFWKRWHITLSSWVKDYIYIPLGGRNSILFGTTSLFITMFLMGLWHGAAWNFVLWGIFWFALIMIYRIINEILPKFNLLRRRIFRYFSNIILILIMFHLTCYSWIIFRSQSLNQIVIFTSALLSGIDFSLFLDFEYFKVYLFGLFLLVYMIFQSFHKDLLFITKKDFVWQITFYLILFFLFIESGEIVSTPFIYFQF
ncbi:MBOAT family protein [Candidatus Woesearchaeota archaeon]|nr:MBOAT family protein [Candidatus Woesearchaeota archaeon]